MLVMLVMMAMDRRSDEDIVYQVGIEHLRYKLVFA